MRGASWAPRQTSVVGGNGDEPSLSDATAGIRQAPPSQIQMGGRASSEQIRQATLDSIRAIMLIRAYRMRGHLLADLDPLKLNKPLPHPELDPQSYGFTERDMHRPIFINYMLGLESATLSEIVALLQATYCGKIGVEYMHIMEPDEKA